MRRKGPKTISCGSDTEMCIGAANAEYHLGREMLQTMEERDNLTIFTHNPKEGRVTISRI